MLKAFHDQWYAPNNAILIVAGNLDPAATLTKIRELFAGIPSRKLPARASLQFQPVKPQTFTLKSDLPYGLEAIAMRAPGITVRLSCSRSSLRRA